jgi:hypothetical protein
MLDHEMTRARRSPRGLGAYIARWIVAAVLVGVLVGALLALV